MISENEDVDEDESDDEDVDDDEDGLESNGREPRFVFLGKYKRKKIKEGTLDDKKRELFEALLDYRSNEHTGRRRKKL